MNLFCNATGNPPPTLSWTKDGSPLNNNQGILFSGDNETLSIASINRSESGNYRCVARNSLGNDSSNPANVDVQCECSSNSFLFCLIWKVKFYSRSIGFERYLAQMKVMGEVAMGSEELKAKTLGITIQILNWVNVKYKSDIFFCTTNVNLRELNNRKIYDIIGVATCEKKTKCLSLCFEISQKCCKGPKVECTRPVFTNRYLACYFNSLLHNFFPVLQEISFGPVFG